MQVDQRADLSFDDAGMEVIRRLALWLRPLFPETRHDVLVRFLVKTSLDAMVVAYLRVLRSASRQQPSLFFSNDFGTEQLFDSDMHSESADEGRGVLRPGDQCAVVFPALLVEDVATQQLRTISKRYVLRVQPPGGLEDFLR